MRKIKKIKVDMSGAMVVINSVGTQWKDRDIKILTDKINEIIDYLASLNKREH